MFAAATPSTVTDWTVNPLRSKSNRDNACVACAVIVARPVIWFKRGSATADREVVVVDVVPAVAEAREVGIAGARCAGSRRLRRDR